jgi:hypothetical protein
MQKTEKTHFLKINKENLSEKTMNNIRGLVYERAGALGIKNELFTVATLFNSDGMDFLQKQSQLYPIEWANKFIDQVLSDIGFDLEKDAPRKKITKEDLSDNSIHLLNDYVEETTAVVYTKTNLLELLKNSIVNEYKEIIPDKIFKVFSAITAINDLTDSLYEDAVEK